MQTAFQNGAFQPRAFQVAAPRPAFQRGAFQFRAFQVAGVVGAPGYGSTGKKKRKLVVRKGDRLLVFARVEDALAVLAAEQDAPQEIEAPAREKPTRKELRQAVKRAEESVPIARIEGLAQRYAATEAVNRMIAAAQYAALMDLVERMQDEEDVEMLLLV